MNYWVIADSHLGHDKMAKFCGRPEGFEDRILRNLDVLRRGDVLIHLGDVCFGSDATWNSQLRFATNGAHRWLCLGNHDRKCVSKNTRILTRRGYKRWDEIDVGEMIPTVNLETGKVEFNPILDKYVYANEPFIFRAKHQRGQMEVSAHHVVLYQSGPNRRTAKWKKNIAENVWAAKHEIVIPCCFSSDGAFKIERDLLLLLAWIVTDGGIQDSTITLYQSKVEYLPEIRGILERLHLPYTEDVRNRKIERICGKVIKATLPQHAFRLSKPVSLKVLKALQLKDKYSFPEWLWDISDSDYAIFLNEVVKGDGSFRKNGHRVVWGRKEWLENLMGLCATHDIHTNIKKQSGKDHYYLGIRGGARFKQFAPKHLSIDPYNDMVWCVNVKNHTFFAELGGQSFVTGNSVPWYLDHGWDFAGESFSMNMYGLEILFSHVPKKDSGYGLNIHGHFHNNDHRSHEPELVAIKNERQLLVACEFENYAPVKLETLVKRFKDAHDRTPKGE